MGSRNHDRQITIFSPEGNLYQIEYAIKSVSNCGTLAVCLRGKDSVVMVAQKKVPEKLMDRDYVTNMYKITQKIGCLAIGSIPDSKAVVQQARQMAAKFKNSNGYDIPVHFLASKVGKKAQIFTQHAGVRPLGATIHLCAIDDEKGASLWKCDPAGFHFAYYASAIGPKEQEANNALEKIIKKTNNQSDRSETIRRAIDCLQVVLGQDMKALDMEVGVVYADEDFLRLPDQEVEDHLTAIHEED